MQRFETKYDLLNAAYKDVSLKKGAVALFQYLVHKSNKEQCFPAVDTIAKALGVCRRTVQYNMRKLEDAGYIIRKDRWYNHQQLSNQYVFNIGIIEDIPGEMLYTDEEYETLNGFSFNNPEKQIRKVNEIKKIYEMKLNANEKLLLIYLYHRANKKGIAYDTPSAFMSALGIRKGALKRLFNGLRNKGLLKVKYTILRNQEYLVMQLTGKCIQEAEEDKSVDYEQEDVSDQKKEITNIIQNVQNCTSGKLRNWLQNKSCHIRNFNSVLKKCFRTIRHIWYKIRETLRL